MPDRPRRPGPGWKSWPERLVLDTDVAWALLKDRLPSHLTRSLTGRTLAITFVTVGELTQWPYLRRWVSQRRAGLDRFLTQVIVLPYSPRVATIWGESRAHAQLRGQPDTSPTTAGSPPAASHAELLLTTLNIKDNVDYAEYEGLELLR